MTAKNSILLMVLQSPGIDYNSLLNKVSANYSNVNSARAALSRAIKDMHVFGLIRRQENNFFATDKAVLLVNSEMKNKLVLKLNQAVNSKKPEMEISIIVQRLSTLLERSKHDAGLLKAAKGSVDFSLSDLKLVEEKVQARASHLNYLQGVLQSQIQSLTELDFNDVKKTGYAGAKELFEKIIQKSSVNEILVEISSDEATAKIEALTVLRFKKNSLNLALADLEIIFGAMQKLLPAEKTGIAFFVPPVKITFKEDSAYFFGPFSFINSL